MPTFNAIVKVAAASVPIAAAGKTNFFVDIADDFLKGKNELDAITIFAPSVASAIGNVSANPAILSASLEPATVGHVWAITSIGPPHAADLVDPRSALVSTPYLTLRAAQTAAALIAIGEYLKIDLVSAAGDVPVTLPPATAGLVDQECCIKIITDGFPVNGRMVVVVPDGADTVDGLAAAGGGHLELVTNYEWRILRVESVGNWNMVG